jgi:diguanylate cyclase (GGDEF)-like protein/PAS domain S-box-containing protein
MADRDDLGSEELALLVKRLDRQRRARLAAEAISEQATRTLYEKQQHLLLLQAAAVAANESTSFLDAVQAVVDQVCMQMHWPVGHVYLPVGASALLSLGDIWFVETEERFDSFRRFLEETQYSPERGLAGRVSAQRAPVSTSLEEGFEPEIVDFALRAGIHCAMAFPVLAGTELVAILEFFSEGPIDADSALLEVLTEIGKLLGQRHVRAEAEVTLRNSEEQYRLLFEANPNPMWVYDLESLRFLAVNNAAVEEYGWSRAEFLEMTIQDLRPAVDDAMDAASMMTRHRRADGSIVNVELTSRELRLPGRRARLVMAVDVTDWRRTEEALRQSERRFRDLLDNVQLVAVLLDVLGIVTYCNPYLLQLSGYEKAEVIGRNWFEIFVPDDQRDSVRSGFFGRIAEGIVAAHYENEIVTRRGDRRLIGWNNTVLRNAQGSVLGTASIGIDITEQRRAESQLLHDAFHDALTGLPNRALFLDRVAHALARTRRESPQSFAVLLLDIDRFKVVNDSLGHAIGDQLLVALGERLLGCLRSGDTVARFGGDEFTIMVESLVDITDATRAASRVQAALTEPFVVEGEEIYTSVSIGIAVGAPEYDRPEQMIRDADTAMYRAKAQGRARYEIFDAAMRAEAVTLLQLETDLRRALERNELRVHYQPIVSIKTGDVCGFEALVRWQHPMKGLVPPAQFISVAEETGLIVPLGSWVLNQACAHIAAWRANDSRHVSMSVNISSRQFSQSDLVRDVQRALQTHGLHGADLNLEITESVLIQHAETALATIKRLQDLGVTISIDDFGTGYSSLSYLHRFPIDKLKIDSSFVRNFSRDRKTVEITRTIIQLADNLDIDVIAEGIENEEERAQLDEMQCRFGQGYLFSRAVPADEASAILARGRC